MDDTYENLEAMDMNIMDPPTGRGQLPPGNPSASRKNNDRFLGLSLTQWAACNIFFMILTLVLVGVTGFLLYRNGTMGNQGPPGKTGQTGSSGEKGLTGSSGERGLTGPSGERGLTGDSPSSGGATYVRWGRTTCRDGVDLVYAGVAGGSSYSNRGGGANCLCLHTEPQWANYVDGYNYPQGYLYGAEYETSNSIYPGKDLKDHDVPCAVCRTRQRSTVLMIPARRECPNRTWSLEYKGYLMTSYHNATSRTLFECMDDDPEVIEGSGTSRNAILFHPVEAACLGSLPCPNYVTGREITCVLCSL